MPVFEDDERHDMAKAKKSFTTNLPRIQLHPHPVGMKSSDPSLLLQRLKELDREFTRQTKQLAQLTKDFAKKLTDKL